MPTNSPQNFIQHVAQLDVTISQQLNELENELREFIDDINTHHIAPIKQARDKLTASIEDMIDRVKRLNEENAKEEVIRDQKSRLSKSQQQLIQLNNLIRGYETEITEERDRIRHAQNELLRQSINSPAVTA